MNTAKIMTRQIMLSELLADEISLPENIDVELTGIELDSRRIEVGDLFFACKGANFDGREFVDEVIVKGASAVLVEAGGEWSELSIREGVPVIPIESLVTKIGKIAGKFFDNPARDMWLIGITGTNGKTSCCQFISQCLTENGYKCGVSGTLGYGLYGEPYTSSDSGPGTTPDAITVQRIFEEIKIQKANAMVMEVSSHGLMQKRVNVSEFDVAVFTNLSRDHIDYHGSMQLYGETKQKLFNNPHLKIAVVNIDDKFSANILNSLSKTVKSYTYSIQNSKADVYPRALQYNRSGFSLEVVTPWGEGIINSSLMGAFNASNLLAVLATVMATEERKSDFNFDKVLRVISNVTPVKGRMEIIPNDKVSVVVDYAHTPEGLRNSLQALREHFDRNIICVFGCGGNRDKGKRPLMAGIAEKMADKLIVTDDNPREEPSAEIIDQILSGITDRDSVIVESDRARAIEFAINSAEEGDVVLIAGKGHEEYQDVGGNKLMFSDVKQARLCLNKRFS